MAQISQAVAGPAVARGGSGGRTHGPFGGGPAVATAAPEPEPSKPEVLNWSALTRAERGTMEEVFRHYDRVVWPCGTVEYRRRI